MNKEYNRFMGRFIEHPPRKPTAKDAAARMVRRRIEDIKEASRLERESLLDVWDLDPRELK